MPSARRWGFRSGAARPTPTRWSDPARSWRGCPGTGSPGRSDRSGPVRPTRSPGVCARAIGSAAFTVIETPGHTVGHVSFWREDDRVLVLGDVLSNLNIWNGRTMLCEPQRIFTLDPARNRRFGPPADRARAEAHLLRTRAAPARYAPVRRICEEAPRSPEPAGWLGLPRPAGSTRIRRAWTSEIRDATGHARDAWTIRRLGVRSRWAAVRRWPWCWAASGPSRPWPTGRPRSGSAWSCPAG